MGATELRRQTKRRTLGLLARRVDADDHARKLVLPPTIVALYGPHGVGVCHGSGIAASNAPGKASS